jgi:ABC-2 type transport system ATP-binding protein
MDNVLEIRNVKKSYGDKLVVDNVSFTVKEGDILGFLGPNGAGKSTTISIITSITSMDGGEILFRGKNTKKGEREFKSELGVVPQDLAFYEDLNAYDNVKFFCSLYHCKGKDLKDRTKKALEFVGLWDRRKEMPRKFSGGMKRRLNIACSIAHLPKILIMDEPTVGIDPQSRNHIMEAIKTLNKNGTTIIFVSHYMEEIDNLCNRVVIMDHGKILEDMGKEEIRTKYEAEDLGTMEEIFLHLTGTELRDKMEG